MALRLERIAHKLRDRVERAAASEHGEGRYGLPPLSPVDFRRAMRLKSELMREFRGRELIDLYAARIRENEYGTCLEIRHRVPLTIAPGDPKRSRGTLRAELKLLHGIGPRTEMELKRSGYRTLVDLRGHPRWGEQAGRLLGELETCDLRRLQRLIHRWLPVSHPLGLELLGLISPQELVFFDLESLGLFGRPVVLLGVARPHPDQLELRQYLARDITEELPALCEAASTLGEVPPLVTYNGRAFDVHFLRERLSYYGLFTELEPIHFDLLPHVRRRFSILPDVRLDTVERQLGRKRAIDLPSALVPDYYHTYLEAQNIGPLVPIIEHNKHDLVTLAVLLGELSR